MNSPSILLRAAGYAVINPRNDIDPQAMLDAVTGEKTEFPGISSLFINTMMYTEDTAEVPVDSGLRDMVKIMVVIGGAQVSVGIDRRISADGGGADGFQAVAIAGPLSTV